MRTDYYIFKTNKLTGKTTHVCNGSHDEYEQCLIHWNAYLYGFMDGAVEILKHTNFRLSEGKRAHSFILEINGHEQVEYFMLLNKEGRNLIYDLYYEECKEQDKGAQ